MMKQNTTRWLYCVECPQYSIRREAIRICTQAVYFLHSTMPRSSSGDWVMSAFSVVLLIFSFQFKSAFLPWRSPRPYRTAACLVYAISFGHAVFEICEQTDIQAYIQTNWQTRWSQDFASRVTEILCCKIQRGDMLMFLEAVHDTIM